MKNRRPRFGPYVPPAASAGAAPKGTPEGIPADGLYTAAHLEKAEHLDYAAGLPPFLRGPYATMYATRPWTTRQYAGFSTAEETNAFFRRALAAGQKGLSVAFDLATHRGYDSDHERVSGDVGKTGVAIDTVEDMKILFRGIPLGDMSVSMTMNGAVIPVMAFYLVAAQEQGTDLASMRGTIQNDILKEFMVRNTYIYPPEASMRIAGDVMGYCARHVPRFNSVSVSGYHMHEAGAPADLELAYALGNGLEYLRRGLSRGIDVDVLARRISFFFGVGMHFLTEVAKLRAARLLWARLVSSFGPRSPGSMALRMHCQTSGYSLTAQEPLNNVVRTATEALAAVLGHTQSLHTNALDEALALPSRATARLALGTQLCLMHETDLVRSIDPLAGSRAVEALTDGLARRAWSHLREIEQAGGMTAAIEQGLPKMRIEEAAARKQARIDSGSDVVVGVNRYRKGGGQEVELLEIDARAVRRRQVERLARIRRERNEAAVQAALVTLTDAAASGKENLLSASVRAARLRATLGEISLAMEKVYGRYQAASPAISGVYAADTAMKDELRRIQELSDRFAACEGRRARILVAKLGQDGHDRGARVIATSFADFGFDVDIGTLFQTPAEAARQAVENDVHVVGISSLAGAHKTLIPELVDKLREMGAGHILVIVGGIVPARDHAALHEAGAAGIFGPGTRVGSAAEDILKTLLRRAEEADA